LSRWTKVHLDEILITLALRPRLLMKAYLKGL